MTHWQIRDKNTGQVFLDCGDDFFFPAEFVEDEITAAGLTEDDVEVRCWHPRNDTPVYTEWESLTD